MKKLIIGAAAAAAMLLFAMPAMAAPTDKTIIYTSDMAGGITNNIIGIDSDSAPDYPTGSFKAAATTPGAKSEIYFDSNTLFNRSNVALGEIKNINYWTKTGSTHVLDPRDWALVIYTNTYEGQTSGWYGSRVGAEPYFSENINDPMGQWNMWSTDGSNNKLRFFESTYNYFGSYTDPSWDSFKTGSSLVGLGRPGAPYASQTVKYISIQTGSGWANGFTGQLDGLKIELIDGSIAKVNFEAPDTTAPDVQITNPVDGAIVSGTVAVKGTVTDANPHHYWFVIENSGGVKVAGPGTVNDTNSFTDKLLLDWDTTAVPDGQYTIKLEARDVAGNKDAGSVDWHKVTVKNTPTIKDDCKNNGWSTFHTPEFKNQGQCVSFLQANENAKKH